MTKFDTQSLYRTLSWKPRQLKLAAFASRRYHAN